MSCTSLASKVANACLSGVWKLRDPVELKQTIAQNLCGAVIGTPWFTNFSFISASNRNDFTGSIGARFTVGASPLRVTALGCYVIPGGTRVHTLRLHTFDCVSLLASATIDFTGKSGLNYIPVTPVTLSAGVEYKISVDVVINEDFFTEANGTTFTTSGTVANSSVFGPAVPCPNGDTAFTDYCGATFRYTL